MNKKIGSVVAATAVCAMLATSALAAAPISVTIDGEYLSAAQAPVIQENRTLVPMRAIFEALGAEVQWDADSRSITATKGDTTIEMAIGQTEMTVDGKSVALEVAPTILNNNTMVPVRAVAESFEAQVDWDAEARQVVISTFPTKSLSESVTAEDGTVLLMLKATYPVLDNPDNDAGIAAINAAFEKAAQDYLSSAKTEYTKEAQDFYAQRLAEGSADDFQPYSFERAFSIKLDGTDLLSGVMTDYSFTGGAHPMTVKTGFTYDKSSGKALTLDQAQEGADKLREQAVAAFEAKIDAEPELFFADAKTTVQNEIQNAQFYLADDGVHFLFQLYDIAPYAAGFQEVTVAYPQV
ncbi:MAG: DUF4163 domain-containing protein [Clostridiales bacterium]|nr:DUF4163 domain-containing protein [Clostridiales bacterium]